MALFCLRHSKPAGQEYVPLQVETQKPLHGTICRIEEKASPEMSEEDVAIRGFLDSFPRFGPGYRKIPDPFKELKDEAWSHIGKKSEEELQDSGRYIVAMKKIEKDAKHSYSCNIVGGMLRSDFQWMMIKDGCFFLQSALHILGGAKLLGYPENHHYFGSKIDESDINLRIRAMFFVGNQIPYVVIREVMKQSFFQEVITSGIANGTWHSPSSLPKKALYLLVVLPELERIGKISSPGLFSKLMAGRRVTQESPSNHVLHCLHCLVLGPGNAALESEAEYTAFDHVIDMEDPDRDNRFPSATELVQKGVTLKKSNGGLRDIRFSKKFFYFGYLYVPPLIFDIDQDVMFQYLISYEITQQMTNHEVAVYLRFLKDFVRSKDDVKLLESKGIIQVKTKDLKDKLAEMITKFRAPKQIAFTENYRLARLHAANFSQSPWVFRGFVFILFTMIPNIFSILSYVYPRK